MKVKIVDIAKKAGVSTGTVDRVIHNRGKVSKEKLELVEKALKEMNYEPNILASFLASKRNFRFAAIVPSYTSGSYWELACEGIKKAAEEVEKYNTQIDIYYFDQYNVATFNEIVQQVIVKEYDGVVIATLFEKPVKAFAKDLDFNKVPYVFIDSDIPNQNNLSYFGSNTYITGKIAARLLLESTNNLNTIFFAHIKFKRSEISVQMRNREKGFIDYLIETDFRGRIQHIEFDPENAKEGLETLTKLLENNEYPVGGIILNSRIYQFADIIQKLPENLRKKMYLIGHDAIPGNVEALKNDDVKFLLSQRTDLQGYDAVKALSNFLVFKEQPAKINYMPIDILLKDNVDYYYNYKL
jgi:LacI family transcriptional regulator